MTKLELIKHLIEMEQQREAYYNTIPDDLKTSIFDNAYQEYTYSMYDFAARVALGDLLYEDVSWFIYEWKPGYCIDILETVYTINNVDEYIEYLLINYEDELS